MRCGNTCGCITAGLLVLGMTFGFYNSSDTAEELPENDEIQTMVKRVHKSLILVSSSDNGDIIITDFIGCSSLSNI